MLGSYLFQEITRYEKVSMIFIGIILALLLSSYGIYSLIQGSCTLVGRGNAPWGTFVTFYGLQARLLSFIYSGSGIFLFAQNVLGKLHYTVGVSKFSTPLKWLGMFFILLGMGTLVIILCTPLFS